MKSLPIVYKSQHYKINMILDVNMVKQKKDTWDCGPAGISMILDFHGITLSIEEIKEELGITQKEFTYAPQLGSWLITKGFEVEIIMLNPYIFSIAQQRLSQEEIKEYITKLSKDYKNEHQKMILKHFKEFLDNGGTLTPKIPDFEDITSEIKEGRPIGALLTTNVLSREISTFNFHFNVIVGFDEEENVYVNDPEWNLNSKPYKYKAKDFLYALHASAYGDCDNASLIMIRKL